MGADADYKTELETDVIPAATLFVCDLTGTGLQDTAIASLAADRAIADGAGVIIHN